MAGRQSEPLERPSIAAIAASLILLVSVTVPASAAPSINPQCDDVADPTLDIPIHELSADIVASHEPDGAQDALQEPPQGTLSRTRFLVPRAEAAAREAFREIASPVADAVPPVTREVATPQSGDPEESPSINTRIPGVSADDLARYRRQMYRTDI